MRDELPWRQDEITLYGKTHPVPRLQLWLADEGLEYSYSGIKMRPYPFAGKILEIKAKVESLLGVDFNSCLANFYRNGDDYVAWHADDEAGLGDIIASVSLGEIRNFKWRHRLFPQDKKYNQELGAGSVLVMKNGFQHNWQHHLPKTAREIEPRINLTFRSILNKY